MEYINSTCRLQAILIGNDPKSMVLENYGLRFIFPAVTAGIRKSIGDRVFPGLLFWLSLRENGKTFGPKGRQGLFSCREKNRWQETEKKLKAQLGRTSHNGLGPSIPTHSRSRENLVLI